MTEVTQGQYRAVMGVNPSHFKGSDGLPVECVSWLDAVMFCNMLSRKENLLSFYRVVGESVTVPDWHADGYRLPTEAEWEYACRAGNSTRWSFGNDPASLDEYAWYIGNSEGKSHPVRAKRPNAWGLYDMHGNAWEWCWDGFDAEYYRTSPTADPSGPLQASEHVYRGGGWDRVARGARAAYRGRAPLGLRSDGLGFRIARNQSVQAENGSKNPIKKSATSKLRKSQVAVDEGFQQLFNGTDLSNWTFPVGNAADWTVQNGVIRGMGSKDTSVIATIRSDYEDYHLRMEICRRTQGCALFLRLSYAPEDVKYYWFNTGGLRPDGIVVPLGAYGLKTGGSPSVGTELSADGLRELTPPVLPPLELDTWHLVEIVVIGNSFKMKVDGQEVSGFEDTQSRLRRGQIGIRLNTDRQVDIRKIEIKEWRR